VSKRATALLSVVKRFFSFPNPVDEVSARLVAAGVVAQVVLILATRSLQMLIALPLDHDTSVWISYLVV
jgi:hypothetical protein